MTLYYTFAGILLCTRKQGWIQQLAHTFSRVYFYIPTNKEGYYSSKSPHTQPRGYTFIYPRTKRERQIAEELGYKTPSAVHKLLKQGE